MRLFFPLAHRHRLFRLLAATVDLFFALISTRFSFFSSILLRVKFRFPSQKKIAIIIIMSTHQSRQSRRCSASVASIASALAVVAWCSSSFGARVCLAFLFAFLLPFFFSTEGDIRFLSVEDDDDVETMMMMMMMMSNRQTSVFPRRTPCPQNADPRDVPSSFLCLF